MKKIWISTWACLWACHVYAAPLKTTLDHLIDQIDPNINMGMKVVDLNTNTTLYERQATQLFVPASNMKLFSEAATLLLLGPDYRFKTQLSVQGGRLEHGVLKGSVILSLSGDPSLTSNNIHHLFEQLKTWGIHRIQGNVVIRSSLHPIQTHAPGVVPKDFGFSYGAQVGPVIVNDNQITVTVNPASHAGGAAIVEFNTPPFGIDVHNYVTTSARTKGCGVSFQMDENNQLNLHGCISLHQAAIQHSMAIRQPLRYLTGLIQHELSAAHVRVDGQILMTHIKTGPSLLLSTHVSSPLAYLMAHTLKASDNVYADSLFLHTASTLQQSPASWSTAGTLVKNFLQQTTHIPLQQAIFVDGSGLSRDDRVTADQTVSLLRYMHSHFPLTYEYVAALPSGGQDGTLLRRFNRQHQRGLVRAKTGTMTGIIGLSGYTQTEEGHTVAFAIYSNTRPGTKPAISGRYRSLIDQIVTTLFQPHLQNNIPFQQKHSQATRHRADLARWRQLERLIKKDVQNQPVTVLFRHQQLMLIDHNTSAQPVWNTLTKLSQKYSFSVILHAHTAPQITRAHPLLLWMHTSVPTKTRTWMIRN